MFNARTSSIIFATGMLAAALAASPAAAQPATPFTGAYVAAIGGWDRMQSDHHHKDGFLYGGTAGYDFASGNLRIGPAVEVNGSTEKGCQTDRDGTFCFKAGRDFYVGGRVGITVSPKALVYLSGGYTNARYTGSVTRGMTRVSLDDDHSGARIGAGIEYAVTNRFFVKSEYRYSNYSDSIARNQLIGGLGVRF